MDYFNLWICKILIWILGVHTHGENNLCGPGSFPNIYASIFRDGDPQTVQWLINNGGQDVKECLRK